jgi:hypothetical protein
LKKIILNFFIALGLLIISACESKLPIPENDFVKMYADMTIMQDTSSLSQIKIRETVLKKYNQTEKNYNKTISYLNDDSERWAKFFDKVITYLDDLKSESKKSQPLILPNRYVLKDN